MTPGSAAGRPDPLDHLDLAGPGRRRRDPVLFGVGPHQPLHLPPRRELLSQPPPVVVAAGQIVCVSAGGREGVQDGLRHPAGELQPPLGQRDAPSLLAAPGEQQPVAALVGMHPPPVAVGFVVPGFEDERKAALDRALDEPKRPEHGLVGGDVVLLALVPDGDAPAVPGLVGAGRAGLP